jgi:ankyrin repeat protein
MKTHETHDPYELMMIPPNKKAEMIIGEIKKPNPNLNLVSDLIVLGANLEWRDADYSEWSILHLSVMRYHTEIVSMLIGSGIDVNVQDKWGNTSLHMTPSRNQIQIAKMLIGAGTDVNVQDKSGRTALYSASWDNRTEIARMLIGAGADVNLKDCEGWTALHRAAINGNAIIAKMLIGAGARKDIQTNNGKLPYDLAITKKMKTILRII